VAVVSETDVAAAGTVWETVGLLRSAVAFRNLTSDSLGFAEAAVTVLAVVRRRLIVVARDEPDLYDYIRRDNVGDDSVVVLLDRRRGQRRRGEEPHLPERRQAERRRHDIDVLLVTEGWAEVRLPLT
jgi:hypothetical protein